MIVAQPPHWFVPFPVIWRDQQDRRLRATRQRPKIQHQDGALAPYRWPVPVAAHIQRAADRNGLEPAIARSIARRRLQAWPLVKGRFHFLASSVVAT